MVEVLFERPDFNKLRGKFVCDMHIHSKYTDGWNTPREMLGVAREKGIFIAITDHNSIRAARELKDEQDVIFGIEAHSREGPHFLLYFSSFGELENFYNACIKPNKSRDPISRLKLGIERLIKLAKSYGAVVAVAHPTGPLWFNLAKKTNSNVLSKLDALEVISGLQSRNIDKKALKLAYEYSLGMIGGSDAHSKADVGRVVTYSDASTIDEFLHDIKNKKTSVVGTEVSLSKRPRQIIKTFRAHIKHTIRHTLGKK